MMIRLLSGTHLPYGIFLQQLTWGKSSAEVEPGAGRRSIIRIGPAGEKGITYASVNVDTYRHFGRLGLGTVFGAKKLKALLISGNREIKSPEHNAYRKTVQHALRHDCKNRAHWKSTITWAQAKTSWS